MTRRRKKGLAVLRMGDQETLGRELIRRPDDDLSVSFLIFSGLSGAQPFCGVGGGWMSPPLLEFLLLVFLDVYIHSCQSFFSGPFD